MEIAFATRPSALARRQTQSVIDRLQQLWPDLICSEVVISTQGDAILDRPLPEFGGKGVFTLELEDALRSGRVQAAVHSLKDLPVESPDGLMIGCIPPRGEVRDALIALQHRTLAALPPGARLGTSSLRRAAQASALRPDLRIESIRGNVDTRLRKLLAGEYDAIILAGAGLLRLGLENSISEWLAPEVMLPAPGQGALAVQCRLDDAETLRRLAALEDPAARKATTAERAFLAALGGGCALPVAALAKVEAGAVHLTGLVAAPDGSKIIRMSDRGADPDSLGRQLAQGALAGGARQLINHHSH